MDEHNKPGCTHRLSRVLTLGGLLLLFFLPDSVRYRVMLLLLAVWAGLFLLRHMAATWDIARSLKRLLYSIRWRFVVLIIVSLVLAVVTTGILLLLAGFLMSVGILDQILSYLNDRGLAFPIILLTAFLLFVIYYILLTNRVSAYLAEISLALRAIAQGDLQIYVPKRSADELGELADNVNSMVVRLRASQAEERRLEEAKNQLIAGVSHDLRTPLTSVLGYLDLVVKGKYDSEAELQRYATIAHQKALRLEKLIDALFEYTRLSYGGLTLDCSTLSLNDLLAQLVDEWTLQLQEANMMARLQLPPEPVLLEADGDLLVRVFENLFSNGIRYGQAGRYLDVCLTTEAEQAVVQVTSYGNVIPPDQIPHVFTSFYRADASRSEQGGGSGLGLAIAQQIVNLHQGSIAVVGSSEEGTTFAVRLPVRH